jgi:hypothetical protein
MLIETTISRQPLWNARAFTLKPTHLDPHL